MTEPQRRTLLIVDDSPENIKVLSQILKNDYRLLMAKNGSDALKVAAGATPPDLILLDIMMPGIDGYEVLGQLRQQPETASIPVIFVTALGEAENEARGLELGAVDYILKPFNATVVQNRVKTHLELKGYRDHLETLVKQKNRELIHSFDLLQMAHQELGDVHRMVREACIETIYRLTLASEYKDEGTGDHLKRVSLYTQELALGLGLDAEFVDTIHYAAPMHDVGKVGIPDRIILKPQRLSAEEWTIMQGHTTLGAKILEGSDSSFLQMAREIALSHHERWNGGGYPQGLQGEQIPLSCRIMTIADQYDALRSKRPYKPAYAHDQAFAILTRGNGRTLPEHFDPAVLHAFEQTARKFEDIFEAYKV